MRRFDNIKMFLDNKLSDIPDELISLIIFTTFSKAERNNSFLTSSLNVKNNNETYLFKFEDKIYSFSILSDLDLQEFDKQLLLNINKNKDDILLRSLKLACSLDLIDSRIMVGNSRFENLEILISFQEKGITKIIDYSRNLIMNKSDYYKIFDFKEINILTKSDLYLLYIIMEKTDTFSNIFEYLIFFKEILDNLSSKKLFSFLKRKYDDWGINYNNFSFMGNDCDCLFFQKEDFFNGENEKVRDLIDEFTRNLKIKNEKIFYDEEANRYIIIDKNNNKWSFKILSDFIKNINIKETLLSDLRYGHCHENAFFIASILNEYKMDAYIIGGKIKANEIDYFFHSWVELEYEGNTFVLDFNHNLIMEKDNYYKLYESVLISKTLYKDLKEIIETFLGIGFNLKIMEINYFGEELKRDLKKNIN